VNSDTGPREKDMHMHHPLSEFRTLLEEKLIGWNLPAELAAQIEGIRPL
jgi:hypothetical protein